MATRPAQFPAIVVGVLALGLTVSCTDPGAGGQRLRVGNDAPIAAASQYQDAVTILWAIRAEDCLVCQTPAADLRSLQRRYGSRVTIIALIVGPNPNVVEGFLRSERLTATAIRFDERTFQGLFGDLILPTLYLVHEGKIVWAWTSATLSTARSELSIVAEIENRLDVPR